MIPQIFMNAIVAASTIIPVGLGVGLVFSTARYFNLALAALCSLAAYVVYIFIVLAGVEPWVASFIAVVVTTLAGGALEICVFRPLRRRGGTQLVLLLVSLGLLVAIQGSLSMGFGDDVKIVRTGNMGEVMTVFGARITTIQIATVTVSAVLCLALLSISKHTRFGKGIRAVASDPYLAATVGINTDRVLLCSAMIGSAFVSIAAVCVSFDTGLSPMMGFEILMLGVVAAIVGGTTSITGIVLAGLLVGFARHFGVWKISSQWQDAITFVILLGFLFIRPEGFFGRKSRKAKV